MTEAEWLANTDPTLLLKVLHKKVSDRKLRLFACACCRRIWPYLKDQRSRRLVEIAELFADGAASLEQLRSAFGEAAMAQEAIHWKGGDAIDQSAAEAVLGLHQKLRMKQVFEGVAEAVSAVAEYEDDESDADESDAEVDPEEAAVKAEQQIQAAMFRDIVGNPFHPVTVDPAWLRWSDGTVVNLARSIYDEQGFDRLPILGDALEDAGCDNADILAHCRDGGEHVRGCWVVGLLLGKE